MTAVIRPGRPEDAPAISRIGRAGFPLAHRGAFPPADLARHQDAVFAPAVLAREFDDPELLYRVAEVAGTVIGFARLATRRPPAQVPEAGSLELSRLYLDPDRIGTGVGSALLEDVLEVAANRAVRTLWLLVWKNNPVAIAFYERWGFRAVGREGCPAGGALAEALLMMCEVSGVATGPGTSALD